MTSFIQTTRRRMLLGLAAASTAAATGASAEGQAAPAEAPELIAMGDQLGGSLAAYKSAARRVQAIGDEWGPQWPTPADEIIDYGGGSKMHRDIHGRGIKVPGRHGEDVVYVGTPEGFQKDAERHWAEYARKMKTKSQRGVKFERLWAERSSAGIGPAQAYWSEVERITKASGIEPATKLATEARESLKDLVGRIVLFQEQSITGLIIKAEAMQAWGEVEKFFRIVNPDGPAWTDAMAETIMRQTRAA